MIQTNEEDMQRALDIVIERMAEIRGWRIVKPRRRSALDPLVALERGVGYLVKRVLERIRPLGTRRVPEDGR